MPFDINNYSNPYNNSKDKFSNSTPIPLPLPASFPLSTPSQLPQSPPQLRPRRPIPIDLFLTTNPKPNKKRKNSNASIELSPKKVKKEDIPSRFSKNSIKSNFSPIIFSTGDNKVLKIKDEELSIKNLGEGQFHKTYIFRDKKDITLNVKEGECTITKTIDVSKAILKIPHPQKGPKNRTLFIATHANAYERLKLFGVPQPEEYVTPYNFEESLSKNGNFWVIEKMSAHVNENEPMSNPKVKEFVKKWLTESISQGKEIIPDFYPRNLMLNDAGDCYIVDPDLPDKDDNYLKNVAKYISAWSVSKNPNDNTHNEIKEKEYANFLISDFSPKIQSKVNAILNDLSQQEINKIYELNKLSSK